VRVLLLESHPGVAGGAVAQLTEAGHQIVRCDSDDARDRALPCRGLALDGACPLGEPVDVALLAREVEDVTEALEHGAICAARDRVPIVELAFGSAASPAHGTSGLAAAVVHESEDVVALCQHAAAAGDGHVRAVQRRLVDLGVVSPVELLEGDEIAVAVDREPNRLRLTIALAPSARPRQVEIVRAARQALRDHDPKASVIDVVVT
jgi:hypothetical protein